MRTWCLGKDIEKVRDLVTQIPGERYSRQRVQLEQGRSRAGVFQGAQGGVWGWIRERQGASREGGAVGDGPTFCKELGLFLRWDSLQVPEQITLI